MITSSVLNTYVKFSFSRLVSLAVVTALALSLAACGSTKVYTADKTMVYKDNLYNMAQVQQIGSRIDGALAGDEVVNMRKKDKKALEALFKEHGTIMVSSIVTLDDREMIYERQNLKKYSDYSKMASRLDSAMKKINKFMADKKKTQLKL